MVLSLAATAMWLLLQNTALVVAVGAASCAQLAKILTHRYATGQWVLRRVLGSGGMPSSHSALVSKAGSCELEFADSTGRQPAPHVTARCAVMLRR